MTLTADAEAITLRVRDDGQGMPRHLTSTTAGIAGMRERALLVGGAWRSSRVQAEGPKYV